MSALHSGHLAAPRFAQSCHRCLRFADSLIVSLSGKKSCAAVPGNSVGNGTFRKLDGMDVIFQLTTLLSVFETAVTYFPAEKKSKAKKKMLKRFKAE